MPSLGVLGNMLLGELGCVIIYFSVYVHKYVFMCIQVNLQVCVHVKARGLSSSIISHRVSH